MKLSPPLKKVLSVVAASIAGGVAAALIKDEPQIVALVPTWAQFGVGAAVLAVAHWLPTWGHTERVTQIANNAFVAGQGVGVAPEVDQ